jgi:L-amino acid N-acyltransferase YncA
MILGYFTGMNTSSVALEIRAALRSDVVDIMRVRREAIVSKAASHYDPVTLNDWADAGDAVRTAKRISDPDYRALVAEISGEITGFAIAEIAKRE